MIGRVNTGGGSALNFSLKAYSTEAALLADTPSENTVGIVTETAITDYMFSSTQPTTRSDGTALSGGEVWIRVGTTSPVEFNALKKNYIGVYPLSIMQCVGGSWVAKDFEVYQSGWKKPAVYLYREGNECTALTSGWDKTGYANANGSVGSTIAGIKETQDILFPLNSQYYTIMGVQKAISLTNFNTIKADISIPTVAGSTRYFWFTVLQPKGQDPNVAIVKRFNTGTNVTVLERQTISLDVSALSGDYYLDIASYSAQVYIYNVWLEV